MSLMNQHTIKQDAVISGIALHTGVRAKLRLKPAAANTGIVFKRIDIPDSTPIQALASNVVDVRRGTTIASDNAFVVTVEHVLAALNARQIDNVIVEMDGPEPPVADGSGQPFLDIIDEAKISTLDADAVYYSPSAPIIIEKDDTKLVLTPSDEFKITCIVSYGETPLDAQYYSNTINSKTFESELAPCRTFCLFRELEQLIAMGLVKGGSLDNAVVLHDGAIISNDGLRFPDELVRHKVLDIVGDIYLIGCRLNAHIIAVKPGHPANVSLAQAILKQIHLN
jgi:UDP-3-O-acyl N-acetylglucosamine deacetylase